MKGRYGEYEQVNGAVVNGLLDENVRLREALEASAKSMDSAIRILNDRGLDYEERVLEARPYLHSRASVAWQALPHTHRSES